MNVFDQVSELYRRYPQPRTFAEDIEIHANHGIAIVLPDFVMLARPVDIFDPQEKFYDLTYRYQIEEWNCWYVWMYCGISRNNPCYMVPRKLPYWAWCNRGRPLKIFPTEKLKLNLLIKKQNELY